MYLGSYLERGADESNCTLGEGTCWFVLWRYIGGTRSMDGICGKYVLTLLQGHIVGDQDIILKLVVNRLEGCRLGLSTSAQGPLSACYRDYFVVTVMKFTISEKTGYFLIS